MGLKEFPVVSLSGNRPVTSESHDTPTQLPSDLDGMTVSYGAIRLLGYSFPKNDAPRVRVQVSEREVLAVTHINRWRATPGDHIAPTLRSKKTVMKGIECMHGNPNYFGHCRVRVSDVYYSYVPSLADVRRLRKARRRKHSIMAVCIGHYEDECTYQHTTTF